MAVMASLLASSVAVTTLSTPTPAAAATHPDTIDLDELDMVPVAMWGVSGQNPADTQTPSLDVLVWDFQQVGDRMFVGGAFLNVQESKNATPIPQPYLAAFDIETGDWDSTFTPQFDRAVYALDVSPGGALLVGGEFQSVNGQAREGLVALDPVTGAIDPSFTGSVERPWSALRAMVRSIEVHGDEIYVAGNFSHLNGANGVRTRVYKVGRLTGATGVVDTGWKPEVAGSGVWGIDVDPGRGEIYLAGYFTSVNGEAETGYFHTVDNTTGASVPGKIELPRNWIHSQLEMFDVAVGNDLVFVIGEQHIVQVLRSSDQEMVGYHLTGQRNEGFEWDGGFAGGAYQVGERIGDVIFAGCHCTYSTRFGMDSHYSSFTGQRTPHRLVMAYDANTGELIESFRPDIHSPRDGTWAIGSDTNGCLYLGGDFHVGGVDAGSPRWVGGFGKLCGDGPRVDGLLVDAESEWSYQDGGTPAPGWTSPGFDDGAWPTGTAELGFGDGDENTLLTPGSITYYARHRFDLDGPLPAGLDLWLKADDGAAVYLNGTEILRDNLPDGPLDETTQASTWRGGPDEDFIEHLVPASALVAGENVLAVEVHNVWAGNGDLGFDLKLAASGQVVEPPPEPFIELGEPWRHTDSSAGSAPVGWPGGIDDDVVPVAGPDPAQFGFGEGDESTVLVPGQEAYYFVKEFDVADPAASPTLRLKLLIDDGAVVYINENEILRDNMPDGPINWNTRPVTWKVGGDERIVEFEVSAEHLVAGSNTITVEVHNYWPGNADLSFDLGLEPWVG